MHGRSYGQWFECYCETNGAGILSSENKTLAKEFQTHSDKWKCCHISFNADTLMVN